MTGLLRELFWLALAFSLSWWLAFHAELPGTAAAPAPAPGAPSVALTPVVANAASPPPAPNVEPLPQPQPDSSAPAAPVPPPAELGTPDGDPQEPRQLGEADTDTSTEPTPTKPSIRERAEALMQDPTLLERARDELAGRGARGFATVLVAAPEEQLDIARFFGETLVLVPRATLDPNAADPHYFRAVPEEPPRIVVESGRPPLESFRQYRDLFDYEYARLPAVLRELRRSTLNRDDVYLYAALIPVREWALVIARRDAALTATGRERSEVRTFVLRYRRLDDGGFDLHVEEIVFADGSRHRPDSP